MRMIKNTSATEVSALVKRLKHPRAAGDFFESLNATAEAAKLLGNIHVKTLQRYARRSENPGNQIVGHWYCRASELDAWLQLQINSDCQSVRQN
jgi:hypothetical protein